MFIRDRKDKPGVWFAGPVPGAEAAPAVADCMLAGLGGGGCIGGGRGGAGTWKENEPIPMPGVPPRILPMMSEIKLKRLPACGCGCGWGWG
jgi:hypothetical protein